MTDQRQRIIVVRNVRVDRDPHEAIAMIHPEVLPPRHPNEASRSPFNQKRKGR